ncbi:Delta-aminolevulinic acid dehydratase [Rickettsia prowazekii str. GvF12]|nr:Delta-aminolevulinic acid dehydratase [Rickettsia prowazekii str. GvF12]
MYPLIRFRRNRKALWLRELIAESNLSISDLVLPLFVVEGHNEMQEIKTMPGIYRLSIDQIVETAKKQQILVLMRLHYFLVLITV